MMTLGGLATAWKLSKDKSTKLIHIYDRLQPGLADGSSNSAGIMHPMAPKGGKVIWKGMEGMEASYQLMNQVETKEYGKVYNDNISLHRVIYKESELLDWKKASELNPNMLEIINNSYENTNTDSSIIATAKIKYATIVNPVKYLKSLWQGIQTNCDNTEWKVVSVDDLEEIRSKYDIVILACGAGVLNLVPASKNKIRLVRGQNLLFDRSSLDSCYDFSVGYLNGEYIIPHHRSDNEYNSDYLICGATHEHITNDQYNSFLTESGKVSGMPNIHIAEKLLNDKLHLINPSLKEVRPFAATSGTRAVTQRRWLIVVIIYIYYHTLSTISRLIYSVICVYKLYR